MVKYIIVNMDDGLVEYTETESTAKQFMEGDDWLVIDTAANKVWDGSMWCPIVEAA